MLDVFANSAWRPCNNPSALVINKFMRYKPPGREGPPLGSPAAEAAAEAQAKAKAKAAAAVAAHVAARPPLPQHHSAALPAANPFGSMGSLAPSSPSPFSNADTFPYTHPTPAAAPAEEFQSWGFVEEPRSDETRGYGENNDGYSPFALAPPDYSAAPYPPAPPDYSAAPYSPAPRDYSAAPYSPTSTDYSAAPCATAPPGFANGTKAAVLDDEDDDLAFMLSQMNS
jgi:hypothetical protein